MAKNIALDFIEYKGMMDEFNEWKLSNKAGSACKKESGFVLDPTKITDYKKLEEGKYYYTGKTKYADCKAWIYRCGDLYCCGNYINTYWFKSIKIYEITPEEGQRYFDAYVESIMHPRKKRKP